MCSLLSGGARIIQLSPLCYIHRLALHTSRWSVVLLAFEVNCAAEQRLLAGEIEVVQSVGCRVSQKNAALLHSRPYAPCACNGRARSGGMFLRLGLTLGHHGRRH